MRFARSIHAELAVIIHIFIDSPNHQPPVLRESLNAKLSLGVGFRGPDYVHARSQLNDIQLNITRDNGGIGPIYQFSLHNSLLLGISGGYACQAEQNPKTKYLLHLL
jgi:hypothetical protein